MNSLQDQTAIVTGGGTGIGRSTALALAREGVRVVICGRRPEPLAGVVEAITAAGGIGLTLHRSSGYLNGASGCYGARYLDLQSAYTWLPSFRWKLSTQASQIVQRKQRLKNRTICIVSNDLLSVRALAPVARFSMRLST